MWFRKISLPPCFPGKGGLVSHVNQAARLRIGQSDGWRRWQLCFWRLPLLWSRREFFRAVGAQCRTSGSRTLERGMDTRNACDSSPAATPFAGCSLPGAAIIVMAKRDSVPFPSFPNLAGEDRLSFWKQMEDFRSGKRASPVMQGLAAGLSDARLSGFGGVLLDAAHRQRSAR